jgi:tRNA threonylcarbamoyladenosine biosynthesis protein TsaB
LTVTAPLVLAVETSTPVGSVALGRNGQTLAEIVLGADTRHAEALLPAVGELLIARGLSARDLGAIVVGGGPGSFTGLRIAAATAKGFAHALPVPLFAYSGLLAAAASCAHLPGLTCALFDARRDEVYAACYEFDRDLTTMLKPSVLGIAALLQQVVVAGTRFVGAGASRHADLIRSLGGRVEPIDGGHPRASALIWLAHSFPEAGRIANPAHWEPDYLRGSGAERALEP